MGQHRKPSHAAGRSAEAIHNPGGIIIGDYQRLRQDQGRTVIATVPTPEMRRGDLSALGTPIFDPLSGQPFAGSVIPANRINPITRQVADIFPLPNRSGLVDNYIENNVVAQKQNAFDIRSDVNLARCRPAPDARRASARPGPAPRGWCASSPPAPWRRARRSGDA